MPFTGNLPDQGTNPWYTPFKTVWDQLVAFVNGLETDVAGKSPLVHTHAAGDIASGTLDIARIPDLPSTKVTGLGSASTASTSDFATSAQGAKADSAVQPAGIANLVPDTRTVAGKALSANVTLVKGDVGLANVDNTSDANKPVSTAQQTALNGKVATSRQVGGYALSADAPRAGLNTRGLGDAVFIPAGGTVPGGTPAYTIVVEV